MKTDKYIKPHPCVKIKGKGINCSNCKIKNKGFCEIHIRTLVKITNHLNFRYSFISVMDKEDIISLAHYGILQNLNKETSITYYRSLFWTIYRRRIADFIEKSNKDKISKTIELDMIIHCEDNELQEIIECLKQCIHIDKCVPFYLSILESDNTEALALEMGISYDNCRQKKHRCKGTIQKILSEMCEVNYV